MLHLQIYYKEHCLLFIYFFYCLKDIQDGGYFFTPFFCSYPVICPKEWFSLHLSCVWQERAESHLLHLVKIPADNWTHMGILTLMSIGGHKHFRKKIKVKLQNCLHPFPVEIMNFHTTHCGRKRSAPKEINVNVWRTCKHLKNWNPCCTEPPQAKSFTILWFGPTFKK